MLCVLHCPLYIAHSASDCLSAENVLPNPSRSRVISVTATIIRKTSVVDISKSKDLSITIVPTFSVLKTVSDGSQSDDTGLESAVAASVVSVLVLSVSVMLGLIIGVYFWTRRKTRNIRRKVGTTNLYEGWEVSCNALQQFEINRHANSLVIVLFSPLIDR